MASLKECPDCGEDLSGVGFGGADLGYVWEEDDVIELAAAIRRGDRAEAEHRLDRLVEEDLRVQEWVQRGRYSTRAKPA
jgi:uncharacterized membrane-anchored protein